jgi:hypothetical protein
MLKLTLTTDQSGPALEAHLSLIAQTLGVEVEAIGLDGYVAAKASHATSTLAVPVPVVEVPAPVFTPVFTSPESAEPTND